MRKSARHARAMAPIRHGLSETFCKQRKRIFKSALAFSARARLAPISRFHSFWAAGRGRACSLTTMPVLR